MDIAVMVAAAGVFAVLGAVAGHWQHLLYRLPEQRIRRSAPGNRIQPLLLGLLAGIAAAVAFRAEHYDFGPALLTALFSLALLVLSSADFERRLLPNRLMYPALVAAIVVCWAWPDRDIADVAIGGAAGLAAGLGLFGLGWLFGAARGGGAIPFGFGDAKLIVLLGLLLGWPAFGPALLIGILLAGIPGIVMVALGRGRAVVSYGPYLASGGLVALLFPAGFV
jgi:prepilin signal peptidase PulO-like enzyme (type II secretory pathway)